MILNDPCNIYILRFTSLNATLFVVIVSGTNPGLLLLLLLLLLFTAQQMMKTVQTCRHFWRSWEDRTKPKQDRQQQVSVINFSPLLTILQSYLMRHGMRRQDQIISGNPSCEISVSVGITPALRALLCLKRSQDDSLVFCPVAFSLGILPRKIPTARQGQFSI